MSLAARAREAAREHPFLLAALRAGVVNYRAAADFLDLEGDPEAVATALRRFAADLPAYAAGGREARVRMESGVGLVERDADGGGAALATVGGRAVRRGAGSLTAVVAEGTVDPAALAFALDRLGTAGVAVEAAGAAGDRLVVAVPRRAGARAVRIVEAALAAVPEGAGNA